jgi:AraC-like DNA-binding protein
MPDRSVLPIRRYSARLAAEGTFEVDGLRCFLYSASHRGTSEVEVGLPRHVFSCVLDGERDEMAEESWNGRHSGSPRPLGPDSCLVVPAGQHFIAKTKGSTSHRYVTCEIEPGAFARVFGDSLSAAELRAYLGPYVLAQGIAQRIESLCRAPSSFPLAYAESVAAVFLVELLRAHGAEPRLGDFADAKPERFNPVLDFVEDHLARDIGLFELADLSGLSVTYFWSAFKAAFGMTPDRYIVQRRIERAKTLLQTTDEPVDAICAHVGFLDQNRFSRTFERVTGSPPSAYRSRG